MSVRRKLVAGIAGTMVAGLVFAGCSLLVDADPDQCASHSDCEALAGPESRCMDGLCSAPLVGPDFTGGSSDSSSSETAGGVPERWACIDERLPTPTEDVELTFRLYNAVTQLPPVVTSARLCALLDAVCRSPAAELDFVDGVARATVPPAFEGYLEVLAEDITPSLVYVAPAKVSQERWSPVVPDSLIDTTAQLLGLEFDRENRGITVARAVDCNGELSSGVTMTLSSADDQTTQFYGMLPDDEATSTPADGTGGFLNVPPGLGTWVAALEDGDTVLKELRFLHRAGWASLIGFEANEEFVAP